MGRRRFDHTNGWDGTPPFGEVELVGGRLRGVAVHEAGRIMGKAGADEILVSETTRVFALNSGVEFVDRGTHELKGLAGEWRLHALAGSS